ncbi:MAG: M67 family metallopeptidase [Chloroflexota bacterium]
MPSQLTLTIRREDLQRILDETRLGYPYEVCGLMSGQHSIVERIIPIRNVSLTPHTAFEMERQTMVKAILGLQQAGQEVVAIYHSHPTSAAEPSEHDIALATWPDAVYLIVGLSDPQVPDVRGWIIAYGQVQLAEIAVI